MQIGKPLRTIVVEPLESPVRPAPDPSPDEPQPAVAMQQPVPETQRDLVAP